MSAIAQPELRYVAGFLFTEGSDRVALISKLKPAWQRGKLNGIGGKIEGGESPWDAMCREFREETGAEVTTWREFAVLNWRGGCVHFFTAHGQYNLCSMTAEPVVWVDVAALRTLPVIPNVLWLVPLALDKDRVTVVAEDRS